MSMTIGPIRFLTCGTARTHRRVLALLESIRSVYPEALVTVVTAGRFELPPDVERMRAEEPAERAGLPLEEVFHPDDLVAFAVPFALDALAGRGEVAVLVDSDCLVTNRLRQVEELISDHQVVLATTHHLAQATSRTRLLDQLMVDQEVSPVRLVAFRPDAAQHRDLWRRAMEETVTDAFLRPATVVTDWVIRSLMKSDGVALSAETMVVGLAEYAELATDAGAEVPALLDCGPLWEAIDAAGRDEPGDAGYTGSQLGTLLMDLRVHDIGALADPLRFIEVSESGLHGEVAELTADRFLKDVRRASDPLGLRWAADGEAGFRRWLYETNAAGLTRVAHLYWLMRTDVRETFPEVRWDVTRYRRWNGTRAVAEIGMDLFVDRPFSKPEEPFAPPPTGLGRVARARNAVAWRKNVVKSIVPSVRNSQAPKRGEPKPPRRRPALNVATPFGEPPRELTLAGFLRSNSGLGQATRASFHALEYLGREFSVLDTTDQYLSRNTTDPGIDRHPFGAFGDVNLIHANAAEFAAPLGLFHLRLGGRLNAAMWFWEGAELPGDWLGAFERVDELWVASEFLADVFGQYGRVPVHVVGLAADLPEPGVVDRREFGLEDDEFVFLFVFDAQSVAERKNPVLALEAFTEAFGRERKEVRFIVKTHNLHKMRGSEAKLRTAEARNPRITIVNEYWDREKLLRVMQAADVYVSPHAAEGFGLTLLESMALGTPVIATGYSGNMDFTDEQNSWLLDYRLVRLNHQAGPYPEGTVWARPRLDSIIDAMRSAAADPGMLHTKGVLAHARALEVASIERYAENLDRHLRRLM